MYFYNKIMYFVCKMNSLRLLLCFKSLLIIKFIQFFIKRIVVFSSKNPPRAAQKVSAGRIWPAGRTLGTTDLAF